MLKDYDTVIACPGREGAVVIGRNSGMAAGGSGDILAGIITGLLAQGYEPYDAARIGVCLHSEAGWIGREKTGVRAMMARDILEGIAAALKSLE